MLLGSKWRVENFRNFSTGAEGTEKDFNLFQLGLTTCPTTTHACPQPVATCQLLPDDRPLPCATVAACQLPIARYGLPRGMLAARNAWWQ
jgi:hypothetical protein